MFGHYFPSYFKNWWSDDWISTVYGSEHTFRNAEVVIQHNVESQKTNGPTRYEVDHSAQLHLDEELLKGHALVDAWLKKNELPRLPLHDICGYAPLVRYIAPKLQAKDVDANGAYKVPKLPSSSSSSSAMSLSEARGDFGFNNNAPPSKEQGNWYFD